MDALLSVLDWVRQAFATGPGRDRAIVTLAILILVGVFQVARAVFKMRTMLEKTAERLTTLEGAFQKARRRANRNHRANQSMFDKLVKALNLPTPLR